MDFTDCSGDGPLGQCGLTNRPYVTCFFSGTPLDELPDDFKPLALKVNDIHRFQEYTSGSYLASASVKKLRLGSEILAVITYWLTNWLVGLPFGVPALREPFLPCQTGPSARI